MDEGAGGVQGKSRPVWQPGTKHGSLLPVWKTVYSSSLSAYLGRLIHFSNKHLSPYYNARHCTGPDGDVGMIGAICPPISSQGLSLMVLNGQRPPLFSEHSFQLCCKKPVHYSCKGELLKTLWELLGRRAAWRGNNGLDHEG